MSTKSAVIDVNFFSAEERSGFFVSSEMKKIWSVELNILSKFIEVCERNSLKYFADGGTLLGAVRHNGFIPWDNDIDVAMPRPDFNKLLQIGSTEFTYPYFFQTPVTEKGRYFRAWIKICKTDTTGASVEDYKKGINCGIFIDIFPLDILPDGYFSRALYLFRLQNISKSSRFCFAAKPQNGIRKKVTNYIRKIFYSMVFHSCGADELFMLYSKTAETTWNKGKSTIADVSHGYIERFSWRLEDWSDSIDMPFETIIIKVPVGYDSILKKQYGDYMKFPKDKSTHSYLEFHPEIPYLNFFGNERPSINDCDDSCPK